MLAVIAFLAIVALVNAHQECGRNERWSDCAGCEVKCGETPGPCTFNCHGQKCECPASGYRRTNEGRCIPAFQCPQHRMKREEECAENEKWLACKGCEETCEERAKNGGRPGRCTRKCHGRGCECVAHDEFVRNAEGKCIKFEDCPK